ncbi:transport and Golgi organization protein 1 [Anopheles cruzii]|uniref:transport and Golgi organization protein 1 n=1 Tax=Anopheles cruzii TaxID=68878 RepID=UPI0022EC293E|nr:transport and Golgi organization protein 1 [Anopheles cruzii]
MKRSANICFVHILCLGLVFTVFETSGKLCGDPECSTAISTAQVTIRYRGGAGQKVNVEQNEHLEILAKNVGKDESYWVRKSDGKEGLLAKYFVRETKILVGTADLIQVSDNAPQEPSAVHQTPPVDTVTATTPGPRPTLPLGQSTPTNDGSAANVPKAASLSEKVVPNLEVIPNASTADASVTESNDDNASNAEDDEGLDEEEADESEEDEDEEEEEEGEIPEVAASETPKDEPDATAKENEHTAKGEAGNSVTGGQATLDTVPEFVTQKISEQQESGEVETKENGSETESTTLHPVGSVSGEPMKPMGQNPPDEPLNKETVSEMKPANDTLEIPKVDGIELEPIQNATDSGEADASTETAPELELEQVQQANTLQLNDETVQQAPFDSDSENRTSEANSNGEETKATVNEEIASTSTAPELGDAETVNMSSEELTTPLPAVSNEAVEPPPTTVEPTSAQPTHPTRILSGGLGNLLANSHHHHHHHHNHLHHNHNHNDHVPQGGNEQPPSRDSNPRDTVTMETVGTTHLHFPGQGEMTPPETTAPHGGRLDSTIDNPTEGELPNEEAKGYCDSEIASCDTQKHRHTPPFADSVQRSNGGEGFMQPLEETVQGEPSEGAFKQSPVEDGSSPAQSSTQEAQEPMEDYVEAFLREAIKLSDLILMLAFTSFTLVVFLLGHYVIKKNRREKPLIYKLNMVERDLMTAHKETALLRAELHDTKYKLTSIENNSFGSNDMVIALKADLEAAEATKQDLQDQIAGLEKELENAAEAGLELNKMVAELLNQNGSDSIALSVEELQRQLNEQQQTILSMNASLAEKSRENSELQIAIAQQTVKSTERIDELERQGKELAERRGQLEVEAGQLKSELQHKLDGLRKENGAELERLTKELKFAQSKADETRKTLAASEAKCDALEQCLKEVKSPDGHVGNAAGLIDMVELKAKIALLTSEKASLQDKLQGETIARQLVEDHMKMVNEEISSLKRDFGKAEKDKLEAETRLEVLSSYFKEKETQLQKELSVKEAMWMKQQGETTSTVEKIRHMQDETQQLKSQNDKLRAEIEAQAAAHKAQYTTLETRSHDAWLATRQAERRAEEARSESSALRRKLTALGDVSASSDGMISLPNASITQTDLGLTAPSPIRVESPNAPPPMMGVLPPPPFMPPFMPGPPPPFMPPFMPPPHGPGEMRPPPLGRLMSPPPNRYSPNSIIDARDRYSPDRGRYSPDSRYDYSVMSTYETENDFSPPPSPPHHSRHSNYDREWDRDRGGRDRDQSFKERDRDRGSDRDRIDRDRDGRASGNGGYARGFTPTRMRTSPPIQDPRNKKYAGGFSSGSQDSLGTRKSSGKYKGGTKANA